MNATDHRCVPKGNGRRHRLKPKTRRVAAAVDAVMFESVPAEVEDAARVPLRGQARLLEVAGQLWQPNYEDLFRQEFEANCATANHGFIELTPSTYRAQLKGESAARYDRKKSARDREELAIRLHSHNQQHWSPSMLARSLAYHLNIPTFISETEVQQRRIASYPIRMQLLRCEPIPPPVSCSSFPSIHLPTC